MSTINSRIFGELTNKQNTQEDAFKTPGRKHATVKDILRDDLSPMVSTPRPRNRSAINDIFSIEEPKQAVSTTKNIQENQPRFENTDRPIFPNLNTEELFQLKQENKILQDTLKNEVKARSELENKFQQHVKQLQKVSNDLVSRESYAQQLEKKVNEDKENFDRIARSFEIQERNLREQLEREKQMRLDSERQLSDLREAQKSLSSQITSEVVELQTTKVQLSQLRHEVTDKEKTLQEKEKSRNRRSIGFHEEHRLRVELEMRLEEVQHDHQTVVEKLKEEIIDLQDTKSFLSEKIAQLEMNLDISTRKYFEIVNSNNELISDKSIQLSQISNLNKDIEDLKKKLEISYSALKLLEVKYETEVHSAEKKIQWTEDQVQLWKLAQYQSQKHSEELEQKSLKQKQALVESERLFNMEASARTHLQEELLDERLGNIPVMKKLIQDEHSSFVHVSAELESAKRNLAAYSQALDLQRVQTQELSQALANEVQNRQLLEKQFNDLHSQAQSAVNHERDARMQVEREYQNLLSSMRQNL